MLGGAWYLAGQLQAGGSLVQSSSLTEAKISGELEGEVAQAGSITEAKLAGASNLGLLE